MSFEKKGVIALIGLIGIIVIFALSNSQLKLESSMNQMLKDLDVITTVDQAKIVLKNGEIKDVSIDDLRKIQESLKSNTSFSSLSNKISQFEPISDIQIIFTNQEGANYTMDLVSFDGDILNADLPVDVFENKLYPVIIKYNGIILKLQYGFLEYLIENGLIQPIK